MGENILTTFNNKYVELDFYRVYKTTKIPKVKDEFIHLFVQDDCIIKPLEEVQLKTGLVLKNKKPENIKLLMFLNKGSEYLTLKEFTCKNCSKTGEILIKIKNHSNLSINISSSESLISILCVKVKPVKINITSL